MRAISGSGPDDIWAAGGLSSGPRPSLTHWNGRFWTVIDRTPRYFLSGVAVLDSNDAWAVGTGPGAILHYDPLGR